MVWRTMEEWFFPEEYSYNEYPDWDDFDRVICEDY